MNWDKSENLTLKEQLTRSKADFVHLEAKHEKSLMQQISNEKTIRELKENVNKLKEALEFYANTKNWIGVGILPDENGEDYEHMVIDGHECIRGGKRAREALWKAGE